MSIEKQVQILQALVNIMHISARGPYEEMNCEFEYRTYDGGWSVGAQFNLVRNGAPVSEFLDDPTDESSSLVHELHAFMKAHTGGHWKQFLLTVDATGKAQTKFRY